MKKFALIFTLIITIIASSMPAVASFPDIQGNWAREAITRLDELGIFDGVIDENFKPNSNITREELIEIASRGFDLSSTQKQTLYTWLDHFVPMEENLENTQDDALTRAELVSLIANLLDLVDQQIKADDWRPSFEDIDQDHPAFVYVEAVNKLGILPTYLMDRFEPNRLATRAEIAALLDAALQLETINGEILEIHQANNRVILESNGKHRSLPINENTYVYQNGHRVNFSQLEVGSSMQAIYDKNGVVKIVNVAENNTQTANLFEGLTELTQGLEGVITPQQIMSIVNGDWSGVGDGFRFNIYQELVDLGLTPWEAEALLDQDWHSLQTMSKDRIAYAASDYADISPELVFSALDQNWNRVLEYAQVEIAERLLSDIF